ncbi:unnamed protein product [Bursaphelenchus okinawaensis]|uniref:Uncharacterized protein n=1 Tax=Bursaphelenchus okinawaensis TaxID=465554 RepID=A0A811KTG9_9BILA|nr:unnamed protein product [Bursaphelenchus okinawaensis]CAG9109976.1 unnamed protein product [Bursaphelenchus okinawaensis]
MEFPLHLMGLALNPMRFALIPWRLVWRPYGLALDLMGLALNPMSTLYLLLTPTYCAVNMTAPALNMTWFVRSVTRSLMLQSGKRMRKYANQQGESFDDDSMDAIDSKIIGEYGIETKGIY